MEGASESMLGKEPVYEVQYLSVMNGERYGNK
jgi:hypothetical protein